MRRYFLNIILLLLFLSCTACHQDKAHISDYQRIFLPLHSKNGEYVVAIRVFKRNNTPSFLLVNPSNLATWVAPVDEFTARDTTKPRPEGGLTYEQLKSTLYYQLLHQYGSDNKQAEKIENQGLTHAAHAGDGNILTIDLCPSSLPFEKEFFEKLVQLSSEKKAPIPITIAMSGLWMIDHPKAFSWLISMHKNKKLKITWANHSFTHIYYHDLPDEENFLRSDLVNMETEIMLTEQYLLEHDQTPSVFFRFPGLVSSKALLQNIQQHGLIPLGADAWIAKDEAITPGGIILVHGNSNEHIGIVKLLPQLERLKFIDIYSSIP
jgi:peptidoglycan/xylan/chitin deacetylase (PgdA/CDA1 family)